MGDAASGLSELLRGGKYLAMLQSHLSSLQSAYGHGNRRLHLDDLLCTYLLCFFNPTLRSLRTISDWSHLAHQQGHLQMRRLCRSTLSDANALMDARLLVPILRHLRSQLPQLRRQDPDLQRLLEKVLIVDGSFFDAAADIAFALQSRTRGPKRSHQVRLDVHLEASTLLPCRLIVQGKGKSESKSLLENIEPAAIYVMDRAYTNFELLSLILARGSDFLLRVKESIRFDSREEQVLDETDRLAGVLSDQTGELPGSPHSWKHLPRQMLREVVIADEHHPEKPIRLLTSLLDVPAGLIAQLYRYRWQIELFFRWLKVHANFRHLISHSKNGMSLGFHAALIAVLLMYLKTKRPLSKYAFNLLSFVASGYATMEQILPILEAREQECERDRQRQKRRSKTKTR